jgi:hypothetical protein
MGKKSGVVPQLNNAVGQASLGRIPGSSWQPPATPDRILGKDTANRVAEGVGALGTGTAGMYGPSPTQAMLSGPSSSTPPQANQQRMQSMQMPTGGQQFGGGAGGAAGGLPSATQWLGNHPNNWLNNLDPNLTGAQLQARAASGQIKPRPKSSPQSPPPSYGQGMGGAQNVSNASMTGIGPQNGGAALADMMRRSVR